MDSQPLQVLIIAAAGRFRTSLQAVVASLPMVQAVYIADNEATVVQTVTTVAIDLVLLDGALPSAGQRRLLRRLGQSSRPMTTILLGGTEQAYQRAAQAGVTTWLPTDCSTELLVQHMHSAVRATQHTQAVHSGTVTPPTGTSDQGQITRLIKPTGDQAAYIAQVAARKEPRMTESTDSALVTALRDFFMARNGTELRLAYLALAQVASQPAPRGIKWDELEFAFNRLFIGPKALFAPPYASVYLEPQPQLMGRTTLKMREFYQLLTLASPARQLLPEDHLGLELDAYRQLQIAAAQVHSEELFLLLGYLCNHLCQWVPHFVARVHCAEGTPPALRFVVDQLAQWLAAEEVANKSRALSNSLTMLGVAV